MRANLARYTWYLGFIAKIAQRTLKWKARTDITTSGGGLGGGGGGAEAGELREG